MLRIVTAGSVDDGKSTLIGRLLYDSQSLFDDVVESTRTASRARNGSDLDLALLTDGLRAEREQGITIDVAYRYFQTEHRKFILADTPGHVHFTRNMVTGASTADAALIIIDARNGVVEQTRRHTLLAVLLGIREIVVCINKMDLVGYSQTVFDGIAAEFSIFLGRLTDNVACFIPISALNGDNVVEQSLHMSWYEGAPLLRHLDSIDVSGSGGSNAARLPVQYVISSDDVSAAGGTGFAGTIYGGELRVGQEIAVQPSGSRARIVSIDLGARPAARASAQDAVSVYLSGNPGISRGDVITPLDAPAQELTEFEATVCWLGSATDLETGRRLLLRQPSHTSEAEIGEIVFRLDISDATAEPGVAALSLNDIGRVKFRTNSPVVCDDYADNRHTGNFVLVDEDSGDTVAAGMFGPLPFPVQEPAAATL